MDWSFRLLGAAAAFLLLLGISVAVATGPIAAGSPNQPAAPSAASTTPFPQPFPSSAEVPAPLPLPTTGATAGAPAFVPVEERPVAVFLGDSITRGATDPSFGVVDEYSWFYGLIDDSVGAVRWGGTVAEIGMTTSWIADQAYNALALSPDILIVHGGTNDISGEIDMPYLISNFQRIKDAADAYGIPLAVCTVPPREDPAADARAIALNDALRIWAAQEGVILLDTAAPLRNPAGGWNYGYSADGLHPTPAAGLLMSQAAAEALQRIPQGV
ncbi:MAG: GDSL-type esterase/lipase family protein [Actinomycetota bacterium]